MSDRKAALVLLAVLALAGCEDKPKETRITAADAAAPGAAVDPNLAQAVANAKKADGGGIAAQNGDGPPERGVFAPGKADKELERGKPPKIVLGDPGKEPRQSFSAAIAPGWKQTGSLEITLKLGRAALPALKVDLSLEAPKAAPVAAGQAAAPAGSVPMVAKITNLKPVDDLGPQGQQLAAQLGKMKGSRIDYRLVEGGVGVDFSYKLAAGAQQDLEMILRAISEALETFTVGFPKEAVGPGGMWLVTTRENTSGADVVAYRLVKLEAVEGDQLTVSVNTKRYAAAPKLELAGLPPGTELEQFQSTTEGKLTVKKGVPLASSGTTKQSFLAQLVPAGQSDQRLAVQSAADVSATFGKK